MTRIVAIFLALLPFHVQAELLCGDSGNVNELSIRESDLNLVQAQLSVTKFRGTFSQSYSRSFEDLLGQINDLKVIEGTLLRQSALVLKYKYLHSKKIVDKDKYKNALKSFCQFKASESYVD